VLNSFRPNVAASTDAGLAMRSMAWSGTLMAVPTAVVKFLSTKPKVCGLAIAMTTAPSTVHVAATVVVVAAAAEVSVADSLRLQHPFLQHPL
jgi:hypothetical protein